MFLILSFLIVPLNPQASGVSGIQVLKLHSPAWLLPLASLPSPVSIPVLRAPGKPAGYSRFQSLFASFTGATSGSSVYVARLGTSEENHTPPAQVACENFHSVLSSYPCGTTASGDASTSYFRGILETIKCSYWVGYTIALGVL